MANKHMPRNYVGPNHVFWVKELPRSPSGERRGIFRCNNCGKEFYAFLCDILRRKPRAQHSYAKQYCEECMKKQASESMSRKRTKYIVEEKLGPYKMELVERFKAPALGRERGIVLMGKFICPHCGDIFEAPIDEVNRGFKVGCPRCAKLMKTTTNTPFEGEMIFNNWTTTNYVGRDENRRQLYYCRCNKCNENYEIFALDDLAANNVPEMCDKCLEKEKEQHGQSNDS